MYYFLNSCICRKQIFLNRMFFNRKARIFVNNKKIRYKINANKHKIWNSCKIKVKFEFRNETNKRMPTHLMSEDLDNLLFLDVINEDYREQSKLISILISSLIQQSPLLNIYKEKKKLLLDTLNSQRVNEKNLFREKLVNVIFGSLNLKNFLK